MPVTGLEIKKWTFFIRKSKLPENILIFVQNQVLFPFQGRGGPGFIHSGLFTNPSITLFFHGTGELTEKPEKYLLETTLSLSK